MEAENTTQRLDQYVLSQLPKSSRSFASKLITRGDVKVNGKVQTKAGGRIKPSDKISINFDAVQQVEAPAIDLPVVYEDSHCVVINKPAGVLSHSKGAFNPEATVATWLASRAPNLVGERAGIVHRLDRATSGLMIVAKTDKALSWLQKQFAERKVVKTYMAVVNGQLKQPEALIDMPIERNPKKPQTFRVGINGKAAKTGYRVLKSNQKYSILELRPQTGRTHQLRVHLSEIKHPILGDKLYGGAAADRLYLHSCGLELMLPSKKLQSFQAEIPSDFVQLVQ